MARTSNARKTTAKKTPRTRKQTPSPLPLANPPQPRLNHRPHPWMTDIQGHATLAALLAGITTPNIRDWHDHQDGTTTRQLEDGSTLHYTHTTRTLRRQAPCPMGAVHEHVLRGPADTDAAHADTDGCQQPHWTAPPADTGQHLTARLHTASKATADTQPLNTADIADGLTARADHETPKGHPEP
ncbi:hypothetical protein [Streptomyces sp. NPDC004783]|uniref:hypothetical protein n=1 Tax=Streptomyces sp. NPDC004783 TaxID=3154459 RepID=UPI0033B8C9C3